MKRICAWCGKILGAHPSAGGETFIENISHGICESCQFHMKASTQGMDLNSYIENFPEPVVLASQEGMIINANKIAREGLNVSATPISKLPPGEVFECKYAFSSKGCGNTEHCQACCLRRLIVDSLKMEQQFTNQKIVINQQLKDNAGRSLAMEISSIAVAGVVFLKIQFV